MKKSLLSASALCAMLIPANAAVFSHYSFDSNFNDTSGNGRNGTLTDVGTTGNSAITSTAGEFQFGGGAMNFSADRDFLAIPSKTFGSGSAYTIAFWAKKAAGDTGQAAQWDMVIGERDNTIFFLALNDASGSGDRDGIRWRSNTAATGTRQTNHVSPDDTSWHHHTITATSSGALSYYLDGSLVNTVNGVSTGFIFDTIGEAYTSGADFDFHGQIDELWIFDEALNATEVSNLEQFNTTVPEPGTTALAFLATLGLLRRRR